MKTKPTVSPEQIASRLIRKLKAAPRPIEADELDDLDEERRVDERARAQDFNSDLSRGLL